MTEEQDAEQRAATTSPGELLSKVTQDLSTLFRQEIQPAKAEVKESATSAGKGAGKMGGAAYAALTAADLKDRPGMP
ncbi:phage holin family protein [Gryllotalpicola ginsengisoli]|uniref:phage holin family protein n=1 Tax=Gryllotalpicola ginsengisoli TaxID=444608 RepID=UPI0003B35D65|nr:phage holin family protein [Gryllotalpicola ginsengisoli]